MRFPGFLFLLDLPPRRIYALRETTEISHQYTLEQSAQPPTNAPAQCVSKQELYVAHHVT